MRVLIYPITAVSLWGLNFVLLKALVGVVPPHVMNALRTMMAALAFMILARGVGFGRLAPRDALYVLLFGIVGNGVFQWFLMEGVLRTPASVAAVTNATNPAWLALVAYLWLGERLSLPGYLGIALAAFGVAMLGIGGGSLEVGVGVLMLVAASLAWAIYSVSARTVGERYPLLVWVTFGYVGGMLPYWLLNAPTLLTFDYGTIPAWAWVGILVSGLGANVLAYLAWMRAIQLLGASKAGVWQNLAPVLGALGGYLVLGERLPPLALLGGGLVLAGVALTQRARSTDRRGSGSR